MDDSFLYQDTPPQELLDALHRIDIPRLYDPSLTRDQRTNLISLMTKRLDEWRAHVSKIIKDIQGRYRDKENRDEINYVIAPYRKLEELGNQLKKAIIDLDRTLKQGRVLPQGFGFGEVIFGDYDTAEWRFGSRADEKRFEDLVYTRNRLNHVKEDIVPLKRDIELAMQRAEEFKADLQGIVNAYKVRKSPVIASIVIAVLLILVVILLGLGYVVYNSQAAIVRGDPALNPQLGGAMLVLATIIMITSVMYIRRRRQYLNRLKEDIQAGRIQLRNLQEAAKKIRLEYYPVQQLGKELTVEYKKLRATFPND